MTSRILKQFLQSRPGGYEVASGRAGLHETGNVVQLPAVHRRSYAAAQVNRLTEGWQTVSLSANADIHASLDALRARSRQLMRDDPYARKFGQLVATNVVGSTGFGLQARIYDAAGQPDQGANRAVESAFAEWAKVADVTGRQTLREMCRAAIVTAARDGEILIRYIRGNDAGNPFGLALQLIDADRLDTRLNRAPEMGYGQVRMGIEVNAFGRPVAAWLRNRHPGETYASLSELRSSTHTRIPAEDLVHAFISDRPEQFRGVPWMHAAMARLNNLNGYEEAAIVASRVGASKMGFIISPDGADASTLADSESADTGQLYTDVEAGAIGTLPPGATFQPFNPDYPQQMYEPFVQATLRGISSGLGVAYHALANDLEGVSFSSVRSGTLEERDQWMLVQQWFIDAVLEPIYAQWLGSALAFGRITLDNGSALPLSKRDKFAGHIWQARRWEWVDPLRDIQAHIAAIDAGLQSPQRVAQILGRDYEDLLEELRLAGEARARAGVVTPEPKAPMQEPAA